MIKVLVEVPVKPNNSYKGKIEKLCFKEVSKENAKFIVKLKEKDFPLKVNCSFVRNIEKIS